MESKRLFVSVNVPEGIRERIFSASAKVLGIEGFKLAEKESLHFTLKFLGSTPAERVPEICKSLAAISDFKGFKVSLSGFGAFGRKILWLGVSEGNERMQGLNSAVNKALHLEPESFIPHLTLARNKNASNAEFGKALSVLKKLEISESFLVEGFELMESVLSEKGALHSKIASFRLSKS